MNQISIYESSSNHQICIKTCTSKIMASSKLNQFSCRTETRKFCIKISTTLHFIKPVLDFHCWNIKIMHQTPQANYYNSKNNYKLPNYNANLTKLRIICLHSNCLKKCLNQFLVTEEAQERFNYFHQQTQYQFYFPPEINNF